MIDSSSIIRANNPSDGSFDNWQLALQFMSALVDIIMAGSNENRVGAVVFGQSARLAIALNSFTDAESINEALMRIPFMGANSNIPEALNQARTQCFNAANGERSNARNIAIFLSPGIPSPASRRVDVLNAASQLKTSGVFIYSLGITDTIDLTFLETVSSQPQEEGQTFFTATDFTVLDKLEDEIVGDNCDARRPGMYHLNL